MVLENVFVPSMVVSKPNLYLYDEQMLFIITLLLQKKICLFPKHFYQNNCPLYEGEAPVVGFPRQFSFLRQHHYWYKLFNLCVEKLKSKKSPITNIEEEEKCKLYLYQLKLQLKTLEIMAEMVI